MVIPNGIDTEIFKPSSQIAARAYLGLDQKAIILLYSAARGRKSFFNDYEMFDRVLARLTTEKPDNQ